MRGVLLGCVLAAGCWLVMFSPWTSPERIGINFWGVMTGAAGVLAAFGLVSNRTKLKNLYTFQPRWIAIGLLSAAVLYLIFFVGDKVSAMVLDSAALQVSGIYASKSQASTAVIGTLLLLWIGPAEEIFWRGFVQQRLAENLGAWKGYLVTSSIYAVIHIWAFNFMLVMAALICGLFWGWMFLNYKSVWPGLISHAVWDLTIFVLVPIR